MKRPRRFNDLGLEMLYRHWYFHRSNVRVVVGLCILTSAFLVLGISHLPNPNAALLFFTVAAALALALNIVLNVQSAKSHHRTTVFISIWLCVVTLCTMCAGDLHGLLPTTVAIFVLYTVLPFEFGWTVAMAMILSLAQLLSFLIISPFNSTLKNNLVNNLLASVIVHVWVNVTGIYLFCTRETLCRTEFLNSKNLSTMEKDLGEANSKLESLLGSILPAHIVESVQSEMGIATSKVFVEHHSQISVVFARINGLHPIIQQINTQDAARLINEIDRRIWLLAQYYRMTLIQSDSILAIYEAEKCSDNHALTACLFAQELVAIIESLRDATTAELSVKVGIGTGAVSTGIIGVHRWHYDVVGIAVDMAMHMEREAFHNTVFLSEDTKVLLGDKLKLERVDSACWKLLSGGGGSSMCSRYLRFPMNKRFSLVTVPQAINRVLQQSAIANCKMVEFFSPDGWMRTSLPCIPKTASLVSTVINFPTIRRKSTAPPDDRLLCDKLQETGSWPFSGSQIHGCSGDAHLPVVRRLSQSFRDPNTENGFHLQTDRWLIPSIVLNMFSILIYGLFQILVMPFLLYTTGFLMAALILVLVILLILYINNLTNLCQFLARTKLGHTILIVLIVALIYACISVIMFSCPTNYDESAVQHFYFSAILCALWIFTASTFTRFPSLYLLVSLFIGIVVYGIHLFFTHARLTRMTSLIYGWNVQVDVLVALLTLVFLVYLQARTNERMIRSDYSFVLKALEDNHKFEGIQFLCDQLLLSALPSHIAYAHKNRTEPYSHACQNVGILVAKLGTHRDWQGEFGFDRLNRIIAEVDHLILDESNICIEKVHNSGCVLTLAVGILPEIAKNVTDTPFTICDQLAALATFGFTIKDLITTEGLDIAIGMDCGPAISLVVGNNERPRYELVGAPYSRAQKLAETGSTLISSRTVAHQPAVVGTCQSGVFLVTEEIILALQPRANFEFNDKDAICVAPGLTGYLLNQQSHKTPQQNNSLLPATITYTELASSSSTKRKSILSTSDNSGRCLLTIGSIEENWLTPAGSRSEINAEGKPKSNAAENDASQQLESPESVDAEIIYQLSSSDDDAGHFEDVCVEDCLLNVSPKSQHGNKSDFRLSKNLAKSMHIRNNPLESIINSLHSSFSSDLYSIDLNVETDESELEWITPEMIANNRYRPIAELTDKLSRSPRKLRPSVQKFSQQAPNRLGRLNRLSNTEISSIEVERRERQTRNGQSHLHNRNWISRNRFGRGMTSGSNSIFSSVSMRSSSVSISALDRLNSACRKVDRMLKELAYVDVPPPMEKGFPTEAGFLSSIKRSVQSLNRNDNRIGSIGRNRIFSNNRGSASTVSRRLSDYDNAESITGGDGVSMCSDFSEIERSRASRLRSLRKLRSSMHDGGAGRRKPLQQDQLPPRPYAIKSNNTMRLQKQFPTDNGNEADIDSNCSSPMISSLPSRFKWSSVRSIGYDNEYEFKNYDFEPGESQYSLCSSSNLNETQESFDESKCVGGHTVDFRMIDDTGDEPRCSDKAVSSNTTKAQVEHLSKAIRENFGEFELEMFPEFKSF